MTETKRWAIALVLSVIIALGGNYWMSTIDQARMDVRITQVESSLQEVKADTVANSKSITQNLIAINEVNQGWDSVAKAVEANTTQLTRFTEVLIRLEERSIHQDATLAKKK